MKSREPALQQPAQRAGQARRIVEIDDVQRSARRQQGGRMRHGLAPGGIIERAKEITMRSNRAVPNRACASNALASASARRAFPQARPGRSQHFARDIDAMQAHAGPASGDPVQVAPVPQPSSSTRAGRSMQVPDQAVAAEQVILARDVIDAHLAAIDRIHQRAASRAGLASMSCAQLVKVDAAIDRGAVARGKAFAGGHDRPAVEQVGRHASGQQAGRAAVRNSTRAGPGGAGDLLPQR
jgi:hypothetical protein